MTQRTWLITGVSSGFGRELTPAAPRRAATSVVGTVRRPDAVADLVEAHPETFRVEMLDVTDTAAVRGVVDRAFADLGRIDVVISNAGYGLFGAAEELTDAAGRAHPRHEPARLDHADPRGAAAPARAGRRPDHPALDLRRAGGLRGQLAVPRGQVGHRGLLRVRRPGGRARSGSA